MARPRMHTDSLRTTLLAEAVTMVESDGITALPVREVARRAGTSTTAVYSLFGGKEGLQRAVIRQGFDDFAAAQAAVPVTDDAVTDIAGLGMTYIQWALDHPRLYAVMFGEQLVGVGPSAEIEEAGSHAMQPIADAVGRAIGSGQFRKADAEIVTTSLWAQVHGLAALLLAGRLDPESDLGTAAFAVIDGWRR